MSAECIAGDELNRVSALRNPVTQETSSFVPCGLGRGGREVGDAHWDDCFAVTSEPLEAEDRHPAVLALRDEAERLGVRKVARHPQNVSSSAAPTFGSVTRTPGMMAAVGPPYLRRQRVVKGRLVPSRVPLVLGEMVASVRSAWHPAPESGIEQCAGTSPETILVEDCLIFTFHLRYFVGVVEGEGETFGIWDADRRGDPVEVFEDADAYQRARDRLRELIDQDADTARVVAWYRGDAKRPW
jgi:hypothetical protein